MDDTEPQVTLVSILPTIAIPLPSHTETHFITVNETLTTSVVIATRTLSPSIPYSSQSTNIPASLSVAHSSSTRSVLSASTAGVPLLLSPLRTPQPIATAAQWTLLPPDGSNSVKLNRGTVIGIASIGLLMIIVATVCAWLWWKERAERRRIEATVGKGQMQGSWVINPFVSLQEQDLEQQTKRRPNPSARDTRYSLQSTSGAVYTSRSLASISEDVTGRTENPGLGSRMVRAARRKTPSLFRIQRSNTSTSASTTRSEPPPAYCKEDPISSEEA
jgi:hypothetical protein